MPAKLSTHVLDLTTGKPAAGMKVQVIRFDTSAELELVREVRTNVDGRTNSPLLEADEIKVGSYQLNFFVRDYFTSRNVPCDFLNVVRIDFHISDTGASYHVPLLVTPWSYSTYRGS